MTNPFKGKRFTTASMWDEDEEFVQFHVELMGGYYTRSYEEPIDYLVFDPNNDFKTYALNEARYAVAKGKRIDIISFADFQGIAYEYIMKKRNSEGRTNIEGKEFFGFSELTEIEIPEGATFIGDYAFYMCESLTEIYIPSSVKVIGKGAFQGCCNLKCVKLSEGIVKIEESAFNTNPICKTDSSRIGGLGGPMRNWSLERGKLESVTLPDSIKSIGKEAFAQCRELKEITLPPHLEEIGVCAFDRSAVQKYYIYDSTKGDKSNLWHSENEENDYRHYYYNFQVAVLSQETGTVKYVVPMYSDGTKDMMKCLSDGWNSDNGEFDFDKLNAYFSKIKNPEIKAKIADCMMSNVGSMPEERLKIYHAYLKRTAKKRETKQQNDSDFEVKGSKLIRYKGNDTIVEVPDGITEIGEQAFCENKVIKEIILPESVTTMETDRRSESHAFAWCNNLEVINLPDALVNMPDGILSGTEDNGKLQYNKFDNGLYLGNKKNPYVCLVKTINKDIEEIIVPDSCRIICTYAFDDCPNLENISLPDSIVQIEDEGFHSKWNPRKDVYLRRNLNMNMPKGYLRRADKLPSTFTYDLVTTKWRDEVEIEDFAWLYIYQSSKNLDDVCERKMKSDPNRAAKEMALALKQFPKKAGFKKAAGFVSAYKDEIDNDIAHSLYAGTVISKSKDAIDLS